MNATSAMFFLLVFAYGLSLARAQTNSTERVPPGHMVKQFGTERFKQPGAINQLLVSDDERLTVSVGREVRGWNATTGQALWNFDAVAEGVDPAAASYGSKPSCMLPQSENFLLLGNHGRLQIVDAHSGDRDLLFGGMLPSHRTDTGKNQSVDVSSDGQWIAVGTSLGLSVYSMDGEELFFQVNEKDCDWDGNDRLAISGKYAYGIFSPDSERLSFSTSDHPKKIVILNVSDGTENLVIELQDKLVRMRFSADGTKIAATERDNAVRLYDSKTGRRIWSYQAPLNNPAENYVSDLCFGLDDTKIIAGATDGRLYVLNTVTGECEQTLEGHQWYPWSLESSRSGQILYSAGWDRTVRRWNLIEGEQLFVPGHEFATSVIVASPNGRWTAVAYESGRVLVWDNDAMNEFRSLQPNFGTAHIAFSPDGKSIAIAGSTDSMLGVGVWEVATGNLARDWAWDKGRDPNASVTALRFSKEGDHLAAAVFRQSNAYLWDLGKGGDAIRLNHPQIYGLDFLADGTSLITVGWDKKIRSWSTSTGELREQVETRDGMYAIVSSSLREVHATANKKATITLWNPQDFQELTTFASAHFAYGAFDISPDGQWLVSGSSGGQIQLWELASGQLAAEVFRHADRANTVSFGRDVFQLTSGADDGMCSLWDLSKFEVEVNVSTPDLWETLCTGEAAAAFSAMVAMRQHPEETLDFLEAKLPALKAVEFGSKDYFGARRAISLMHAMTQPKAKELLTKIRGRGPDDELAKLVIAID
jgi:WD40 repeat protein